MGFRSDGSVNGKGFNIYFEFDSFVTMYDQLWETKFIEKTNCQYCTTHDKEQQDITHMLTHLEGLNNMRL